MNLDFPAQSSADKSPSASGHWLLQSGRAITLLSKGGGQLRIARGRVWATLGSAHGKHNLWRAAPLELCATAKDYFLNAGDTLVIPHGTRVVMESMRYPQDLPVAFDWADEPQIDRASWTSRSEVVLATGQLGDALGQVGRALRRLMGAVLVSPRQAQRLKTCM